MNLAPPDNGPRIKSADILNLIIINKIGPIRPMQLYRLTAPYCQDTKTFADRLRYLLDIGYITRHRAGQASIYGLTAAGRAIVQSFHNRFVILQGEAIDNLIVA